MFNVCLLCIPYFKYLYKSLQIRNKCICTRRICVPTESASDTQLGIFHSTKIVDCELIIIETDRLFAFFVDIICAITTVLFDPVIDDAPYFTTKRIDRVRRSNRYSISKHVATMRISLNIFIKHVKFSFRKWITVGPSLVHVAKRLTETL